jgi:hypothetical protein
MAFSNIVMIIIAVFLMLVVVGLTAYGLYTMHPDSEQSVVHTFLYALSLIFKQIGT